MISLYFKFNFLSRIMIKLGILQPKKGLESLSYVQYRSASFQLHSQDFSTRY